MNQTETILEFDKIKENWKALALTDWAKQEIEKTEPCFAELELKARLKDTTEARIMLEKCGNPPLTSMEEIRELLIIAQKGGCLGFIKEFKKLVIEYALNFQLGDSVMIYPEKKIGIVCETADDKGVLRVQLPNKKIWINHKRIKLHVAAQELYPEDYDFSIIFDTVENRKLRHKMGKHHMEGMQIEME